MTYGIVRNMGYLDPRKMTRNAVKTQKHFERIVKILCKAGWCKNRIVRRLPADCGEENQLCFQGINPSLEATQFLPCTLVASEYYDLRSVT